MQLYADSNVLSLIGDICVTGLNFAFGMMGLHLTTSCLRRYATHDIHFQLQGPLPGNLIHLDHHQVEDQLRRVRMASFPSASQLLNELMSALMHEVVKQPVLRHKLYQVRDVT